MGARRKRWRRALVPVLIVGLAGASFAVDRETIELTDAVRSELGGTYTRLPDGMVHYRLAGPASGPVVVLVHGGTIPIWTWDRQVGPLVDAGFRVLTYDKFGRGYSDRPDVPNDQSLFRRQLLALTDSLGLAEPFDLVGLSLGGGTAINFTSAYPDRVRRLVLISPVIADYKLSAAFRAPVLGEIVARTIGIRILTDRFVSLLEGDPQRDRYTERFAEQARIKGFRRSILSMVRSDALRDYTDAYGAVGRQERAVMLIWGVDDEEITRTMVDSIRTLIPRVRFEPVEGTGHGIVFQKPDTVTALILDFLREPQEGS